MVFLWGVRLVFVLDGGFSVFVVADLGWGEFLLGGRGLCELRVGLVEEEEGEEEKLSGGEEVEIVL